MDFIFVLTMQDAIFLAIIIVAFAYTGCCAIIDEVKKWRNKK